MLPKSNHKNSLKDQPERPSNAKTNKNTWNKTKSKRYLIRSEKSWPQGESEEFVPSLRTLPSLMMITLTC